MCRSKHAYIRQVVPASHGAIGSTSRSPHLALALLSTPLCSLQKPTLMMLASQVESLWLPWACCSTICRLSALYNVGLNVLLSIMVSDFVKFITETYTYDASFSGRANFTSTTSAAPHFFLVCFVQSGPECALSNMALSLLSFLQKPTHMMLASQVESMWLPQSCKFTFLACLLCTMWVRMCYYK